MQFRLLIAGLILLNAGPAYAAQVFVSINENSQEMTVSIDGQQEMSGRCRPEVTLRDTHRHL